MKDIRRILWTAAALASVSAAGLIVTARAASAQSAADTLAHIAFTNATVIDGTGAPPVAGRTILVSRGVIEAVFETGSRPLPRGVRTVDLAGKFVIP